jgi:hypothetical protein
MTYGELKKHLSTIPADQDYKSVWIYTGEYPYYIQAYEEDFLMLKIDDDDPHEYHSYDGAKEGYPFKRPFVMEDQP